MELLEGMRNDCQEGNISWFPERQKAIVDLITKHKPHNIIQIGFNMGHSALLICDTIVRLKNEKKFDSEPVTINVFDICEHECTVPNFKILSESVKQHGIFMNLIPGSSLDTIPKFMLAHDLMFDFVEVDGCHTYDCLIKDVMNTWDRILPGGVIYIDDFNSSNVNIPDVDKGIMDIDWSGFDIYHIDGAFWGCKKYLTMEDLLKPYEQVNHPNHYGGENNPYEAIKVIDAWDLGFALGNTVKYISRAGKKDSKKELEDLKKAMWYLQHHISKLEN